jgi:CubicO group peptidase (beta-lactamase class C family)
MSRFRLAAAALLVLAVPALAQRRPATPPPALDTRFDAQVDSVLAAWKVPGLALAVVHKGKVVHLKGYGYKDVAGRVPVTPATKFAIGSVTKSFVVTGLATQLAQGKVEWDKPVREYLPDFRMYDAAATERMTPRDLVTHRSGLPRHDLLWGPGLLARDELYQRLRFLEPTRDFRSYWQYQNLMYMTAGYLSGRLNGSTWEQVVRDRIFTPLGMRTADLSVADLQRSADFAYGYALTGNTPQDSVIKVPYRNLDAVGPAGSINASVEEMAAYLAMHMAGGRHNGTEIIGARDAREMQAPQMVMPKAPAPPTGEWLELGDESYGMGLFINNYRGRKLVHHGGNIDGFSAELNFLPNDSIGVVVLTNLNGTQVRDFIPYLVYDRLLGLSPIDWSQRYRERLTATQARAREATSREEALRRPNTQPGHPLDDYVGTYTHAGYGPITISRDANGLKMKFMTFEFPLEHYHFDVFRAVPPAGNPLLANYRWKLAFTTDVDGDVVSLTAPVEPALRATTFNRPKPTR